MIIVVDDDCFHLTEFLTIGYLNENEFTFLAAYSLDEGADDVQRWHKYTSPNDPLPILGPKVYLLASCGAVILKQLLYDL